ncbi:MAG: hypothetical protein JSS00_10090 [Proteobacteria bacterium]|nr:hypothetical protein [Pseudomonadota bacterium]
MADAKKRLMADLSDDYDDVVQALGRMTRHLGAQADDIVSESARTFVHSASDLAEKIKTRAEALAKKAGEEVKEHPIATAAFATAAVGLLAYAITHKDKAAAN